MAQKIGPNVNWLKQPHIIRPEPKKCKELKLIIKSKNRAAKIIDKILLMKVPFKKISI